MKTQFDIKELLATIQSNDRTILGIDGLSRSGKTTFVEQLRDSLKKEKIYHHIFHIDDHIVERSQRYHTGFEEWYEYFHLQWDVRWLRENFFRKLKQDKEITLPYYDPDTDTRDCRTITLPESGLIIVEGVFLQRKEWADFYHQLIFLDCPREKRFMREAETAKQNRDKFAKRYWKAEDYYMNTFRPWESADIVLET
ncbi:kinase [Rossellomorea aquimaris]|uniref:Uridine kinase n=1 Tax=Rossellomorea aquimaris TaxID=189382 RepID=A0A366EKQ8_9BACI|nr:kinase [Rossellomorea aquimaris]RBP02981.1 uridine kinase [Rossellomorea aquimaris]